MNMRRIDLRVKNLSKFGLIAELVDREDFINDIELARKRLQIATLFQRDIIKKRWNTANDILTAKEYKKSDANKKKFFDTFNINLVAESPFDKVILSLKKKYHRSNGFHNVIKFALTCGVVEDEDLTDIQPSPWFADPQKEITHIPISFPQIAIVINPETDHEQIKKFLLKLRKSHPSKKNPYYDIWYGGDVKSKINVSREWYWRNKEGESPNDIYKTLPKKYGMSLKNIEAAITNYKKLLKRSLRTNLP